jgi:hypothetical protein
VTPIRLVQLLKGFAGLAIIDGMAFWGGGSEPCIPNADERRGHLQGGTAVRVHL